MSGVGSDGHRRPRRRATGNKCSEQQFARHVSYTRDISKVGQSLGDGSLKVLKRKKVKIFEILSEGMTSALHVIIVAVLLLLTETQ